MLISKHILDVKPYHKEFKDITWEESTLRKWLNRIFINNAFNEREKKRIRKTEVVNKDNIKIDEDGEEHWHTKGGNNTKDKVFLLSIDEVKTYFDSDKERTAEVTDYTIMQLYELLSEALGEPESEVRQWFEEREYGRNWWYWLRSPGHCQDHAAIVDNDGSVFALGGSVDYDAGGVRPAIWVNP